MSDMKGPLLECDLLSISSSSLCMYKNSGKMQCYSIKGDEEKIEEDEDEQDEEEMDENYVTGKRYSSCSSKNRP